MRTTLASRLRLSPAALVLALTVALLGALASTAAAAGTGPLLDTGLYQPLDPDGGDYRRVYRPGLSEVDQPTAASGTADAPTNSGATTNDPGEPNPPAPGPTGEPATYDAGDPELAGYEPAADATTVAATKTKEEARKETDAAISEALRLLTNFPACRSVVTGANPVDGLSAPDLLRKLTEGRSEGGNGRIYDFHDVIGMVDGSVVNATATRRGAAGYVTLFKGFHDEPTMKGNYYQFGDGDRTGQTDSMFAAAGGPATAAERRTYIVLHEVAHLTGALPKDHGGTDAARQGFNALIFKHCVRGLPAEDDSKLFPQLFAPAGSGAGGGGNFEDLPFNPSPDGSSPPASNEPLPDSGEPRGVDTDAPVLVTPDNGNRYDEGEVGNEDEDPVDRGDAGAPGGGDETGCDIDGDGDVDRDDSGCENGDSGGAERPDHALIQD